jgi:hypothetical protein
MMQMITAATMATMDPDILFETLVYHSGKKRYTADMNNKMGTQNKMAIGKPDINLTAVLFCLSRSFSQ